MSFTLREILGAKADALAPLHNCPTGKVAYATKAEADRVLRAWNARQVDPMRRFRCPVCAQFHLGHRRGVV